MNYMKFALLYGIIICSSLFSFAQKPTSPVLEVKLIKEIALLIDKNKTIPLTELKKQLNNVSGKKAKIPKVSPFVYDPKNLYELCKPSTLIVAKLYKCGHCTNWHSGSATGFPLSRDGVFATNYHVIDQTDGETLAVMDTEGNIFPVTDVLAGDKSSDVAILRADGAKFRPLPLGDPAAIGSSVHVISHPDGMFYYYSKGMVSLYDGIIGPGRSFREWMMISADYARGSSGAAVLNDFGEVVGMVASTVTINYEKQKKTNPQMVIRLCAPINAIRKLIE
jgi:serine protease Do